MKRFSERLLALVFMAGLSVGGCAITPTDLSSIKVGATRSTVENWLGQPVSSAKTDLGTVDTYQYDRGAGPITDGGSGGCGYGVDAGDCLVAHLIALPVIVAADRVFAYFVQRGEVAVTYGPKDTVVALEFDPKTPKAEQEPDP